MISCTCKACAGSASGAVSRASHATILVASTFGDGGGADGGPAPRAAHAAAITHIRIRIDALTFTTVISSLKGHQRSHPRRFGMRGEPLEPYVVQRDRGRRTSRDPRAH